MPAECKYCKQTHRYIILVSPQGHTYNCQWLNRILHS